MSSPRRLLMSVTAAATAALTLWTGTAPAATYTDSLGDYWGNYENDITSVAVTNDANNLTFKVTFNPNANLTNNYYANLDLGIQTGNGAGGQTAINTSYGTGDPNAGTPWGQAVGISTGMNFFAGVFPDGPSYPGGAQLYQYSPSTGWSQLGSTLGITEAPSGPTPSIQFSLPLSSLGLAAGNSFKFDLWSTYGGANSAYDALDNPYSPFFGTTDLPYSSGGTPPAPYDSASTLSAGTYTVTPPRTAGDANENGRVDPDDFALLDRGFARYQTAAIAPGSATWSDGDFNGDGVVDPSDYLLIDQAFAQTGGLSPTLLATRQSEFGDAYVQSLLSSVPEPTLAALAAWPLALATARRHRTRRNG